MPTIQQWWDKSTLSLQAARLCLDQGNLPAAGNRLWYAVFQGAHAVLIRHGRTPRQDLGTWAHEDVVDLYVSDIMRLVRTRAARNSLHSARRNIGMALIWRIAADYNDHGSLNRLELRRALAQLSRVLQYLEEECLK